MTPEFAANSTNEVLTQNSEQLGSLGALTGMQYLGPVAAEGLPEGARVYLYKMLCANGSIYEQLYVDGRGRIAGEQFRDTLATPSPAPTDTPETPLESATPRA
jgi:hypothetical protein